MGMRLGRNQSRHRASLAATALAVLLPVMGPHAAADALRDGLLECANKADDSARLRCFDATVADLRKGGCTDTDRCRGCGSHGNSLPAGAAEAGPATAPDRPSPRRSRRRTGSDYAATSSARSRGT